MEYDYTILESVPDAPGRNGTQPLGGARIIVEFPRLKLAQVNELRRTFYKNIEVLKLTYFHIRNHYSNFTDTILCDRLSLLAMRHEAAIEEYSSEFVKGGQTNFPGVRFELQKEGPGVVYGSDLKLYYDPLPIKGKGKKKSVEKNLTPEEVTSRLRASIIHPETPIIHLYAGQKVDLSAYAVRGNHNQNAAFTTGLCTFYEVDEKGEIPVIPPEEGDLDHLKLRMIVESYGQYSPQQLLDRLIAIESKNHVKHEEVNEVH